MSKSPAIALQRPLSLPGVFSKIQVETAVATTAIDRNGQRFTLKALESMWRQLPERSIFDADGKTEVGSVVGASLNCNRDEQASVSVRAELPIHTGDLYREEFLFLIPKFVVKRGFHDADSVRIIQDVDLLGLTLASKSADSSLAPIPITNVAYALARTS